MNTNITDTVKPKRKYNSKSKLNLRQYKELEGLAIKNDFLSKLDKLGLPKETISAFLPVDMALNAKERDPFYEIILLYLKDFKPDELNSSDYGDIIGLAICKVMEVRLLSAARGSDTAYLDIVNGIEKIHKREEKLKESLASRRSDRIDIRKTGGISIVDLAAALDEEEESRLQDRVSVLVEQNKKARRVLMEHMHEDD